MRMNFDRVYNTTRLFCVALVMFPASVLAGSADLARVAPENTTLYLGWSGRDHAVKAAEGTATGKTLADPQVQRFLSSITETIDQLLRTRAVPPDQLPLYEAGKRILSIIYRHPTALIFLNMQMIPNAGPAVNVAIVSHVAGDGPALLKDLDDIIVNTGMMPADQMPNDPTEMRPLPLPIPGGVSYGMIGDHFVLAIGPQTKDVLVSCMSGDQKSLADGLLKVAREKFSGGDRSRAMCGYVNGANVRSLAGTLLPMFTGGDPAIATIYRSLLKKSGYDRIKSLSWELHFKDEGCQNGIYVHTDGKPGGWMSFYTAPPLTDKELALIPRDVHWSWAFKAGDGNLYEMVLDSINAMASADADGEEAVREFISEAESKIGLKLGDDLINLIGDTFIVYDSPEDGGFMFTGICSIFRSPDGNRLDRSLRKIVDAIAKEAKNVKLSASQHLGGEITTVNVAGIPIPVAPSWAMHDGWVVFGLYPQVVRNALDRMIEGDPSTESILANEDFVRGRRITGNDSSGLMYTNTKAGAEQLYAFMLPLLQTGVAMAQGEGIPLDISVFPTKRALTRHLFGDTFSISTDDTGVLYRTYGPLPMPMVSFSGPSSGVAASAILISILLPSLSRARELSKRLVSQANLKGIGTCLFIYAHDHVDAFPSTLQPLIDMDCATAKQLMSPKHEEGKDCYVYVAGQSMSGDPRNIVAHERVDLNDHEGVNVLYLDGQVQFVRMAQFEEELAATNARLQK